jgi:ATP-dependent Clp protease ATP-binding subunit ClpA
LNREVETQIENVLAQKLIGGEFFKGDTIRVNLVNGKVVFQRGATELASLSIKAVSSGEALPD